MRLLYVRSEELDTVLLVTTLHLTDVVENASDDILAAMRVAVARLFEVNIKLSASP